VASFVLLGQWTDRGIERIKEAPDVAAAARALP